MDMAKPIIRFKGYQDDWEQRKVCNITTSYSGGTPKSGYTEYYDGDIPFIRSGEIYSDKTELFITELGMKNSSAKMVHEGDILYALYGATSGEVSRAKIDGAINQAILAIVPNDDINANFLVEWFRKEKDKITDTYLQGGQGNLSAQIIKELEVTIPSYDEQNKIGLYFEQLNTLITLHQRKCDETKRLKKYMLQKMFPQNGEKVPEIRFSGFTDDWEQRKLGDVAPLRGGYAFKSSEYKKDGTPIVRISNILPDGSIGADFACYDDMENDENISLRNGDALLAMSGATTGKVSILKCKNTDKYYQNQRVGYFKRNIQYNYDFVSTIVRSDLFKEQLMSVLVAGAQPNVSSKEIDSFEFVFPLNIEEQKKIGQYFANLDTLITLHQRELENLQNIKKFMLGKMFV